MTEVAAPAIHRLTPGNVGLFRTLLTVYGAAFDEAEVYIYGLAVAAAHRRRGVATALIEALRQLTATRGAAVLLVNADHADEPAVAPYETPGRRKGALHFDIPVPPRRG